MNQNIEFRGSGLMGANKNSNRPLSARNARRLAAKKKIKKKIPQ